MNKNTISHPGIDKLTQAKSSGAIDSEIISSLNFTTDEVNKNGMYIFGIGKLGQKIFSFLASNGITVLGFIDNNKKFQGAHFNEIPIVGVEVLKHSDIVYIASETYLNPIMYQLHQLGIRKIISHFQGSILFKKYINFPIDFYLQNFTEDLFINKEKYIETFSLLKDEQSRFVFDNIINYRLTGDITHIANAATPAEKEYFDDSVITVNNSEVFYDCGGYDGDSALHFIDFCNKKFHSIHIFEPDEELLSKSKERLQEYTNVFYSSKGVFDKTTILKFDNTGGLGGTINDAGKIEISTIALDEYKVDVPPTYIKLDIEGVEIEAINGAERLIKQYTPKLAIASYHIPKHFWEVPLRVLTINQNYNLYLRHYSDCMFGSTYYFLPQ